MLGRGLRIHAAKGRNLHSHPSAVIYALSKAQTGCATISISVKLHSVMYAVFRPCDFPLLMGGSPSSTLLYRRTPCPARLHMHGPRNILVVASRYDEILEPAYQTQHLRYSKTGAN